MIVSTFEIRRHDHERQRYRLFVTNLEDIDYEYAIEFHGEQTSGGSHDFANLVKLSFTLDEPPVEDPIAFLHNPHVYGPTGPLLRFTIPVHRTALLELHPPGPARGDARGYVVLRLPVKRDPAGRDSAPQSRQPVRVLLQAESHITRVPEDFKAGATGVVIAESDGKTHPYALSIALASGSAQALVEPDTS